MNEALRKRVGAKPGTSNGAARGVVSSHAIGHHERLLLFDPVAVPNEIVGLAAGREAAVVLTRPWHDRDARSYVERIGAPIFSPPPDERSPDLACRLGGDRGYESVFSGGERHPDGVEAIPGRLPNDVVLWIESRRAVVAGDTLVDFGHGLEIPVEWLPGGVERQRIADGLRPLLDLPVELVLATHGGPTDKDALRRALA